MHLSKEKISIWAVLCEMQALRLYKIIMLNSAEHEIFPLINVKMPTIVGILTFMSRKISILGLSEPEKAESLIFLN